MKHVASLILVAGLCACSGRPADGGASTGPTSAPSAPATDASSKADHAAAADTANAEPAAPTPDGASSASSSNHQGIAVGEPNPNAPGGFHPADESPSPATGLAHFDGYGDMKFGMNVEQAKKAWGGELNGKVNGNACTYLNPVGNKSLSYFAFMFEGGKFVRYDVGNDKEVAPGGGRRGMSADEIKRLYAGRVTETPHKYVDGGKYLKVKGDGGAVVFETDAKGVVTEWHAGVEPQVNYIEGCS
ncbi:lectin [Lysobacter sp. TY2-98]|uniref:lectin n=1 Tax=Lysobacter sp. TY2-98 TaxID=2290922 RepID=UPI0019624BF2|nr:lectin [Lysobacter sp. TY2-98]